jgi:hypothetical protein
MQVLEYLTLIVKLKPTRKQKEKLIRLKSEHKYVYNYFLDKLNNKPE